MSYIFVGIGGGLIGGIIGYFIGRRSRKKHAQEPVPQTATVEVTAEADVQEPEPEQPEEERPRARRPEYIDMLHKHDYYTGDDLEDDLGEMDDFLSERESPEEDDDGDDEEQKRIDAYFIDQDDFYTSRQDFEKIVVHYHSDKDRFYDQDGDDITEELIESGLASSAVLRKLAQDDRTYWRTEWSQTDYEIMLGGGE